MSSGLGGVLVASVALALSAASTDPDEGPVSRITDARVVEASGMVLSSRFPKLAYVVNDSGNDPVVFVVRVATGAVVGTTLLTGVDVLDAEALSLTADGQLLIADIGDNAMSRSDVALLTLDQPGRGEATVKPTVQRVRYADGPADAEGVLVEPGTGRLLITTKGLLGGQVLALPELDDGAVTVARALDVETPGLVTDAAVLPDGSGAVLRTYRSLYVYELPGWRLLESQLLPRAEQGETLAVEPGGRSALVGSEGSPSPIVRVPIPQVSGKPADRAEPDPQQRTDREVRADTGDTGSTGLRSVLGAAGVGGTALLFAGGALAYRRLRR